MLLKDLRPIVGEQTKTNVIAEAGPDNAVSGELWLFSVDESIDNLNVKNIEPDDNVLVIRLECSPQMLRDTDWDSVFNQKAILSIVDQTSDTLTQE